MEKDNSSHRSVVAETQTRAVAASCIDHVSACGIAVLVVLAVRGGAYACSDVVGIWVVWRRAV